ncbi:AAA family ATPase ['Planchonia careya' phytoplasma]|nr:AAA family ATPase ['Planchonia careya' phytoplasma]MDO8030274.1 AAA family ATPase ['Planchonia careya' phytoplasma]
MIKLWPSRLYWGIWGISLLLACSFYLYGYYWHYYPQPIPLTQHLSQEIPNHQELKEKMRQLENELTTIKQQRSLAKAQQETQSQNLANQITALMTEIKTIEAEMAKKTAASQQPDLTTLEQQQQLKTKLEQLVAQRQTNFDEKIIHLSQQQQQLKNQDALEQRITKIRQALIYNQANKTHLKTLLAQNNTEQTQKKYQCYDDYLDEQINIFIQQLADCNQELEKGGALTPVQPAKILTFKDVFGMEAEKKAFQRIIDYFADNEEVLGMENIRLKGVLLYGVPGTGKTHLIKALAGESKAHFIGLTPDTFEKKYIGEGSDILNQLWQEAEDHGKTIIFIDEIDGLINREKMDGNRTSENIINNLLTKLETKTTAKIILIGATNYLNKIDRALRSRFSLEIEIKPLKTEEVFAFLQFYALNNNFLLSLPTLNLLPQLINEQPRWNNRDWVKLMDDSYSQFSAYWKRDKANHPVMLPSDVLEVYELKKGISSDLATIEARRHQAEKEYQQWQAGINLYLSKEPETLHKTFTFTRLNGFGYYAQAAQAALNKLTALQEKIAQTSDLTTKTALTAEMNALSAEIKLCEERQRTQKEPDNLAPFANQPFAQWFEEESNLEYSEYSAPRPGWNKFLTTTWHKQDDSLLSSNIKVRHLYDEHRIELDFNGPKQLLAQDQDYYLGYTILCTGNFGLKRQKYYFHFNPVRNLLSVYTQKYNVKEKK